MKPYQIHGWCNFAEVYQDMVSWSPSGSHFVEVGGWLGKSACVMAKAIQDSGKQIQFDVIDHWRGSFEKEQQDTVAQLGGPDGLYLQFLQNVRDCQLTQYVRPIRLPSETAARLYPNKSLEFVFIDGGHQYEDVYADIIAWRLKVKPGGILAGHDRDLPGVRDAVTNLLGKTEELPGGCWSWKKPC